MLEIIGLSKSFGGLKAVSDVSMSVSQGEIVGIIGPNGAGKTTLLNLITGYLPPTAGSISFLGKRVDGQFPFDICHMGLARTFQIVRPFVEMSVVDNVMTGALFSSRRRVGLAEARELAQRPMELCGLSHKRHVLAGALTIGEKKKLELARALATAPKMLLLDEVMGGLTKEDVSDIIEVITDIHAAGTTIVMIEHVLEAIIRLTHRVIVLNFGSKLVEGTAREVLSHPAVIESYLGQPLDLESI
jgi:branched-chain amino acid transport system ATP-binding protein